MDLSDNQLTGVLPSFVFRESNSNTEREFYLQVCTLQICLSLKRPSRATHLSLSVILVMRWLLFKISTVKILSRFLNRNLHEMETPSLNSVQMEMALETRMIWRRPRAPHRLF